MQFTALSVVQSLSEVEQAERIGEILTLNPELLSLMAKRGSGNYFSQFAYCTLDSAPLTALLKIKGVKASRYAGVDLVSDLLKQNAGTKSVLLFGAKPGVADRVAKQFGLQNYLAFDGFSNKASDVVQACQEQNFEPHIALIALGGLLQFEASSFIQKNLNPRVTVACGGSFDVLAGDVSRAPKWIQQLGMEWAFRVAKQPNRVWRLPGVVKGLFLARQVIQVQECKRAIAFAMEYPEV